VRFNVLNLEGTKPYVSHCLRLSLIHDIVKGMSYLHTNYGSHGNLKSTNCLVDSRFVLKIADFGLHEMRRRGNGSVDKESYEYWRRLLWTAPELLRMLDPPKNGTTKADVYSFSVIVHEICTRQGTFYLEDDEKSPKEIVELVKKGPNRYLEPFRPKLDYTSFDEVNNVSAF
jgi:atrial natriuretic peptide receptor A